MNIQWMTIAMLPGKSHTSRLQGRQRRRIEICLPAGKTLSVPLCCAKAQEVHNIQPYRVFHRGRFPATSKQNGQADDKHAPSFFSLENLRLNSMASDPITTVVESF